MSVALNNDFYKIALEYDFCNIYVWISTNAITFLLYNIIFNIIFFQIQVLLIDLFFKVVTLRYETHILLNTEIRFNPSTFLFFLNICKRNKNLPNNSFMIILFA